MGHDEDSRGDKHNNYGNRGNNSKSKHQQPNNEHYEYSWSIWRPMVSNSK